MEVTKKLSVFSILLHLVLPKVIKYYITYLVFQETCLIIVVGQDIGDTMGTLMFPPGSRVGVISVSIFDDSVVEAEEHFVLELGAADDQPVTIQGGTVEVTITDDDGISYHILHTWSSTSFLGLWSFGAGWNSLSSND